MSKIGKKARSYTKGGSLHTSGAQSQGSVRRKLEKELGRPVTHTEAFKASHIRKKKNFEDPDVWVEPRAEVTYVSFIFLMNGYISSYLHRRPEILCFCAIVGKMMMKYKGRF